METDPVIEDAPETIQAMARWLEFGPSSASNPVYRFAAGHFLRPVGVAAERLQFDLLNSKLVTTKPWLFNPTFEPARAPMIEGTELGQALRILGENRRLFESEISLHGVVSLRITESDMPHDLFTTSLIKAVSDAGAILRTESVAAYDRLSHFLEEIGVVLAGTDPGELELQKLLVARKDSAFCDGVLARVFPGRTARRSG